MRKSMNVPPWKMLWLSDGSVDISGCRMAFSLVDMKWEGDRYAKKSCEDNYHMLFFFWNGDKGGAKPKGWGTKPCGNFRNHCSSILTGTWNYSLTRAMRF